MIALENAKIMHLEKSNNTFEIFIDTVLAKKYKEKLQKKEITLKEIDFDELVASYDIYSDAKKGKQAKELNKHFPKLKKEEIILEIIKAGKISYTKEELNTKQEELYNQILTYIHTSTINAQTKLKFPIDRIKMLLTEIKFKADIHKPIEKQIDLIISKLRPIIPISISTKKIKITVKKEHTKKITSFIKSKYTHCKILKDCIDQEGNYFAEIELFSSQYIDFIKLLHKQSNNEIDIDDL